jgi:hypothetical protein
MFFIYMFDGKYHKFIFYNSIKHFCLCNDNQKSKSYLQVK